MDVLKILKARRKVLKDAYKITGASAQYYRLEELDYLIRRLKEELDQDRSEPAAGLGEGG